MACGCYRCTREAVEAKPRADGFGGADLRMMRMFLCETCGNKRCPHAADHRLKCTGSNEPGQKGSLYEKALTLGQGQKENGEMENIVNFPEREDMVDSMIGPSNSGCALILDGRKIPRIAVYDRGETIDFVLDERMAFEFPREWAFLAASFAANAMAVGAGYTCARAETRDRPFAPQCFRVDVAGPSE